MRITTKRHPRARLTGAVALAALFVLQSASPASADPAITVTPSTGLKDGQTVQVAYTGFPPDFAVGAILCSGETFTARAQCDLATVVSAPTDGNGAGTVALTVKTGQIGTGVCDHANSCFVAVKGGELSAFKTVTFVNPAAVNTTATTVATTGGSGSTAAATGASTAGTTGGSSGGTAVQSSEQARALAATGIALPQALALMGMLLGVAAVAASKRRRLVGKA